MRVLLAASSESSSTIPISTVATAQLAVDRAKTGQDCLEMAALYEYDVIVLDLGIGGPDGHEVLKALRRSGGGPPILALAAGPDACNAIRALDAGADDCMPRPLDRGECLARIQSVVRRANGHVRSVVQAGDVRVDISRKTAEAAGQPLVLTCREYGILEVLALRKGSVVTRELIMNHVYGELDWPELKIVDIYIHRLRRKIAEAGAAGCHIRTTWGRGFCLDAPDRSTVKVPSHRNSEKVIVAVSTESESSGATLSSCALTMERSFRRRTISANWTSQ